MNDTKKPLLYLNMILKDSEDHAMVKRSIDSVKDYVDGMYIVVTYTKATPNKKSKLVKLLKKYKANIYYFKWVYDFAKARQFALDQIPRGKNIFMYWQDADDVLKGAEQLRSVVQDMHSLGQVAVYFNYWYQVDLDEHGNVREVLVEHKRERIIRNDDTWKWIGPLHETLIEQKRENLTRVMRKECIVVHLSDSSRHDTNIDRNIQILEETIRKEKSHDPRTKIYLAKAYLDKGKIFAKNEGEKKIYLDLALNLYHEYLQGIGEPGDEGHRAPSGWAEERAQAWQGVAEIAILSNNPKIAIAAYQEAINEAPTFPEYYVNLSMAYMLAGNRQKAKHWLNVATGVPTPETTVITTPRDLKTRALEVSFQIHMEEGKLDKALEDVNMLLEIMPEDKELLDRLITVKSLADFNKACQSVVFLGKYLEQIKEVDKLPHLVQALSEDMKKEKFASEMQHKFMPAKIWHDDEIAIICGPGFEHWSPNSIKHGLGGSEEAVVYLSQELNKLGWKVTVYANPGVEAGNHDGVEYKSWHNLNPRDEFNVLISWRVVGFADVKPKAKFHMLWMHDIPNNPDLTEERVEQFDKIAVLSEFHKSLLRLHKDGQFVSMPADKIFLTSNGIPEIKLKKFERNNKRLFYASSPDRGLVYLLNMWPEIIKQVPEAELHIYYGFDMFDKIHSKNPAMMQWKASIVKKFKQPGIKYHGRVGHKELHEEMMRSGIWAYPTDFEEISCITAMKAQKLGAIPVVTNFAALKETVKNGLKIDLDITTEEGQKEYVKSIVGLLKSDKEQEKIRKPMMDWADNYFNWDNVAKLWDERFRVAVQNPEKKNQIN